MNGTILKVNINCKPQLTKGKDKVRRAFFMAPMTPEKNGLRDIVSAVLMWDWKLSGLGFFDVDRKLAAGVN